MGFYTQSISATFTAEEEGPLMTRTALLMSSPVLMFCMSVLGACEAARVPDKIGAPPDLSACQSLVAELGNHNRSLRVDWLDKDEAELVPRIISDCEPTFDRNFALASFFALRGNRDRVIELLNSVASNDPENEPKRLELLYWTHYSTFSEFSEATRVVADARERFPANAHTRLIVGADACLHSDCSSALSDLQAADQTLHSIRGLGLLGCAYASVGDYSSAAAAFDRLRESQGGVDTLDDMIVYGGVVSYLNVGQPSDARALLTEFQKSAIGYRETGNIRKAKALIESYESQFGG